MSISVGDATVSISDPTTIPGQSQGRIVERDGEVCFEYEEADDGRRYLIPGLTKTKAGGVMAVDLVSPFAPFSIDRIERLARRQKAMDLLADAVDILQKEFLIGRSPASSAPARQLRLFDITDDRLGVYFIHDAPQHRIKIGETAKGAARRLRQLSTGNPGLQLLTFIPGADEDAAHARFAQYWIEREWFRECDEIMEFIKAWRDIETLFA